MNAGSFLGAAVFFVLGLQFVVLWLMGRAEDGVNDGFGLVN